MQELSGQPEMRTPGYREVFGNLLKSKRLDHLERRPRKDMNHPLLDCDPNRCVLCGRCIFVCDQHLGSSLLTFAGRGIDTVISCLGEKDPLKLSCTSCLACVASCPVGAILPKEQ